MKSKIITGTKLGAGEQLNKVLQDASSVVSMDTTTVDSGKVLCITIIYIPKQVASVPKVSEL